MEVIGFFIFIMSIIWMFLVSGRLKKANKLLAKQLIELQKMRKEMS